MKLLDFPPEIFRRMIQCLVSDAGVVESWELRCVCRTFDQEITENVLAVQPKGAFSSERAQRILNRPENMKHYIAYHVKNPRDLSPELLSKIRQMLDYVTEELEFDDEYDSRNVLLQICAGVTNTCKDIHDLLWAPEIYHSPLHGFQASNEQRLSLGQSMTVHERLIAAMIVRAYEPVTELLRHAPEPLPLSAFENPITAAVRLDDSNMIAHMMNILDRHKSKRFKRDKWLGQDSTFSIISAISVCIAKDRSDVIDLLLGYLRGYTALVNKATYRRWIDLAISSSSSKALKSLLQVAPDKSPFHINSAVFEAGCRTRSPAVVKALLEHGHVRLDSNSTTFSALASSIRSGSVAVVRTVVEAGADINRSMGVHRFHNRSTITPLEQAIYLRKYDVITYLVECGAKVPPKGTWPSRVKVWKVLQKAVEERSRKAK